MKTSRATMARLTAALSELVPAYYQAERDLADTQGGMPGTIKEDLGGPCSAAEIAAIEKQFGPLPPSYRAFLGLFGARKKAAPPGCVLGPKDLKSRHLRELLDDQSDELDDLERANPIADGAIPFMMDEDRRSVLLVPPRRSDGEMTVVDYDLTKVVSRSKDLVAYFTRELQATKKLLGKRKPQRPASTKVSPFKTPEGICQAILQGPYTRPVVLKVDAWTTHRPNEVLAVLKGPADAAPLPKGLLKMFPDGGGIYLVEAALQSKVPRMQAIALELSELLFIMKAPQLGGLCDRWVELAGSALLLAQKAKDKGRTARWSKRARSDAKLKKLGERPELRALFA